MSLGGPKTYSNSESHLLSGKYFNDKRSLRSLTAKLSVSQLRSSKSISDQPTGVCEDYFIFEYTGRDDKLRDWLHINLPVAKILAGFRGGADLIVIDGNSSRPYKVIQEVLDELDINARFTIGIAGTIVIQMMGGGHATVIRLGERMRDAALNDLLRRSGEETQLERDDIIECIATDNDEGILLSTNVGHIAKVVEETFDYMVPEELVEDLREKSEDEEKKGFIKKPDFCFHALYREAWARFKNRKLVSNVFGEVSSSDSTGKGAFDALLFVGGTKLQADLSVNADLKLGKMGGQKGLKSMTFNLFDLTADHLLDLSQSTEIDHEDRQVLRYAAKLKSQEQLEALDLLKRLINLGQIDLVTLEGVRSEIFGDSGRHSEFLNSGTIDLAETCASYYRRLPRTIELTVEHYERIYDQVSDEDLPVDEMEERILSLVATHSSKVTVSRMEDGSSQVDPPEGISFPTVAFSGLVPDGDVTSLLPANTLSVIFKAASRKMKSYLHETVPFNQLEGIEDIESREACAGAMFPEDAEPVNQLESLFREPKRKRSPIELQYLTRTALNRIGGKHYKVPSNASESLLLAYAAQSIIDDRRMELPEKEREKVHTFKRLATKLRSRKKGGR